MANEFTCWDCKEDGTRCDCAWKKDVNRYNRDFVPIEERIARNEAEIATNLRLMSKLIYKSK